MARHLHARERHPLLSALSLVGALLIVGGGLVGLDRLIAPAPVSPRPDAPPAAPRATPSPQAGPALTPQAKPDARRLERPPERPLATTGPAPYGIYRCRENGRTVYADHPCGAQAEALTVAPASAGLSPDRSYAEQLAQLQAERAQHVVHQPLPGQAAAPGHTHDARCAAIDETLRRIDSATRQPLGIPELEHFRAQRKALMDERFSIRCNG
ncbi:MAG TPA: DUF4124 domain-containing protein [Burkholderiaceae bacterium]|nr:DUF4124 domain-containing protein [Burkholderiaceae bacterium]